MIALFPKTQGGNRWIITAIDYATGWPFAEAVPNATEDTLTRTSVDSHRLLPHLTRMELPDLSGDSAPLMHARRQVEMAASRCAAHTAGILSSSIALPSALTGLAICVSPRR